MRYFEDNLVMELFSYFINELGKSGKAQLGSPLDASYFYDLEHEKRQWL